ncbi:helix-hairpin-helix domain-containing protein [Methylobacterium sp. BTF04]|nr:helix-hairpin-helix domain-containing protein [Methylobacterium sp. BTF04]
MAAEPSGDEAVADAIDSAGPRALGSVDLNNASLADLNGLRGGGMIGRAIVQKRPYTSVGELLSKRVLSRSTYERIKDQVTVR